MPVHGEKHKMSERAPYILLVEDEPDTASLAAERIADLGYEIKIVSSTAEARAAIKEGAPLLMLLDYMLPGENGLEFVESFKARGEACPPFIVMTGHSGEEVAVAMLRAGARDYLVKGVSFLDPLKSAVKSALAQLEAARQLEGARLALREGEGRYRSLFYGSRDALVTIDPVSGYFTSCNPAALKMFYVKDEASFTALKPWELSPELQPDGHHSEEKAHELIGSAIKEGSAFFEWTHKRLNGETFSAEVLLTRIEISGLPVFYACIRDITERKRVETERELLLAALEQAGDAIVITGPKGLIQYVNPAFEKITGYSRGEAIGKNPNILKSGKQDEAFYRELWETISSGRTWNGRMVNKRKDGALYTEASTISPVWDAAGQIVSYVAVKKDVTEQLQLETQYRQSQKMEAVGLLAGGIAHDFNNILTAIKGYCSLVTMTLRPDDPNRGDMLEILNAADSAATLTRQLLSFSRKQIMVPEVVDLNQTIGDMIKMLRRIIGEEIRLSTKFFPGACLARVDPGLIEHVIMNLVVNARDAVSKDGVITLETEILLPQEEFFSARPALARGRLICVKVRDNGCGMSPEVQRHIFEPFFTTKERGKGTGLGLSMVYGTVKQSGGEIEVETAAGRGSVFKLYFPLVEAVMPEKNSGKMEKAPEGGRETVLLVEDEESLNRMCGRILRTSGYTVISAAGGKEALEAAEHYGKPVDLLLTDLVMPGLSGRELAREFERRKLARRILYMSGYTDEAIVKHGVLETGIAFIYKPFTVEALLIKLRGGLDGPAGKAKA